MNGPNDRGTRSKNPPVGPSLRALMAAQRLDEAEALLTDLSFLEGRAEAGQVFELVADFEEAVRQLPAGRPWTFLVQLLEEALRRDAHFIARHPSTLFQCLWNSCWWYDSPEAAGHYDPPEGGWSAQGPPWERPGPRLATLLESWRREKEARTPGFPWLRSLRPPPFPLGSPQRAVLPVETDHLRFLCLHFSGDGRYVYAWLGPIGVAAPTQTTLRVWDSRTGAEVDNPRPDDFAYRLPSLSADGRWRLEWGGADGGWGRPVRLCEASSKAATLSWQVPEALNLQSAAFSLDGRRVVAGGWGEEGEGVVMTWDVSTGRQLALVATDHSVFAVAASPDGERAASGTSKGGIQLWEMSTGRPLETLHGHESAVGALAFAPDGRRLASGSHDGTVRVWDLGSRPASPRLQGHPDGIADCFFSTDGRRLVTRSANDTTWLWDAVTGAAVACLYQSTGVVLVGGSAFGSVFADGERVLSVAAHGGVWDAVSGEALGPQPPRLHFYVSSSVLFSPDGRRLAVASRHSGGLRILETTGPGEVVLEGDEQKVTCLAFSPDGERLASGAEDGTVRVWSVVDGVETACLRGHEGVISCVAFAPDGRGVASGATNRTVRVWDIDGGRQRACLRVEDAGVWSSGWSRERGEWRVHAVRDVAFAADGALILTQSGPATIQTWDPGSGACLETWEGVGDLKALAAGFPWRALVRGQEVVVESSDTGATVSWLPCARALGSGLELTTHPAGRTWAGAVGRHLYLFTLEGGGPGHREGERAS